MWKEKRRRQPSKPIATEEACQGTFETRVEEGIKRLPVGTAGLLTIHLPSDSAMSTSYSSEVSEALKSWLREEDLMGRIHKNTFGVFISHVDREIATRVAVRLRSWLKSYDPEVGIAIVRDDGTTPSQLISAARANAF